MRTPVRLTAAALALGLALAAPPQEAAAQSDLHGGWIVTSWTQADGTEGAVHRGLFLFTASGQYSMQYIIGAEREALTADPSESAITAAYNPFVSNAGRYTIEGDVITYEAYVSKDPAYMMGFAPTGGDGNEQTITYSMDGSTLTFTFGEGGPMGGSTMTLVRPGGGE